MKMAHENHIALVLMLMFLSALAYYKVLIDDKIPDKFKMTTLLTLIAAFFILLLFFIAKGCDEPKYPAEQKVYIQQDAKNQQKDQAEK